MAHTNGKTKSKYAKGTYVIVRDRANGELGKRLKEAAQARGTTVTELVHDSLDDKLAKIEQEVEPKKPTLKGRLRRAVIRAIDSVEE